MPVAEFGGGAAVQLQHGARRFVATDHIERVRRSLRDYLLDAALRIDEVQRGPILILEGSPDDMLIVHCDWVVDPHLPNGPADVIYVFLKSELRRMDADHH